MVIIDNIRDFNIDHIFDCGQCFRWEKEVDGSYTGVAFGKIANIKEAPGGFQMENVSPEEYHETWHPYLDMDRDYGPIKEFLKKDDPVMEKAIQHGYGMRILNQDPWETILSFIISQNNNIPRIKKCVESLCENHGDYLGEWKGRKFYDIPSPETLARLAVEDLNACKLGYRAKYVIETARQVESQGIQATEEYLHTLCGVGPKVANCILLFSMNKTSSFPIDVWVKRVMNQLYGIPETDIKGMIRYAQDHFGEYGGIAQQYLFYYMREGRE